MPLFTFLVKLRALMPLLLHLLPLADGALDAERGDAHAGGVLHTGLVFQLARFFGGHFAFEDLLVAFLAGFDGAVDAVGGVDGGDGGEARGDYCCVSIKISNTIRKLAK